jgi:flagellar protein FliS
MNNHDISAKSRHLSRVSEIIVELSGRLNLEDGGEVVENLVRIYNWWIDLIFDASQKNEPERLEIVVTMMGEMRATWEELHVRKASLAQSDQAKVSLDGLLG